MVDQKLFVIYYFPFLVKNFPNFLLRLASFQKSSLMHFHYYPRKHGFSALFI